MFSVDGTNLPDDKLPEEPTAGPNQALAGRMGIVMGTSHHEPMARNQKEYTTWGTGSWNYEENEKFLVDFWRYGAERAKGFDTLFTVGMRGDGDLPLDGANVSLLESELENADSGTGTDIQRSQPSSKTCFGIHTGTSRRFHRCGPYTKRSWVIMPTE